MTHAELIEKITVLNLDDPQVIIIKDPKVFTPEQKRLIAQDLRGALSKTKLADVPILLLQGGMELQVLDLRKEPPIVG